MVALLEFLDGSKRLRAELPDFIEARLLAEIIEHVLEMSNCRSRRLASRRTGRLTSVSWNWAAVAAPSVMARPPAETDTTDAARVQEAVITRSAQVVDLTETVALLRGNGGLWPPRSHRTGIVEVRFLSMVRALGGQHSRRHCHTPGLAQD